MKSDHLGHTRRPQVLIMLSSFCRVQPRDIGRSITSQRIPDLSQRKFFPTQKNWVQK